MTTAAGDPVPLLKTLIACPSVTPETAGVLDVLAAALTPLGFTVERLRFEGGGSYPVDNLFATRGTGGKHLLFAGHTDVVPPGEGWAHPPFGAEIADGRIYGRGAADMKSGVAAFVAAAARAVADGSADSGTHLARHHQRRGSRRGQRHRQVDGVGQGTWPPLRFRDCRRTEREGGARRQHQDRAAGLAQRAGDSDRDAGARRLSRQGQQPRCPRWRSSFSR